VLKADRDFTKETDAAIPEAESIAKVVVLQYLVERPLTDRSHRAMYKAPSISCWLSRSKPVKYAYFQANASSRD